jgi:hypothetical protein
MAPGDVDIVRHAGSVALVTFLVTPYSVTDGGYVHTDDEELVLVVGMQRYTTLDVRMGVTQQFFLTTAHGT